MLNVNHCNYESQLLSHMQQHGLSPSFPADIRIDDKIHRYHVLEDKKGTLNGWLKGFDHNNGSVCVVYGSWKTDAKHVWHSKSMLKPSLEETRRFYNKMKDEKNLFFKKEAEKHFKASENASKIWNSIPKATAFHPYLLRKRIAVCHSRQLGSDLVLPIIDCDENIKSLQYIDPTGNKFLLRGGAKKGHFIPINGDLSWKEIGITEGFSTGATIANQFPYMCVIAAIDAGNLESVSIKVRKYNKNANITIFGDDDRTNFHNPGYNKARLAAISAGAKLCMPIWPNDAPIKLSDFNDLDCWVENLRENNCE